MLFFMCFSALKKKVGRKFKPKLDEDILEKMQTVAYAGNSKRKINWAVGLYRDWRVQVIDGEDADQRILWSDLDEPKFLVKSSLAFSLCRFVTEMMKKNETNYPPNTVKEIIRAIQMYLNTKKIF